MAKRTMSFGRPWVVTMYGGYALGAAFYLLTDVRWLQLAGVALIVFALFALTRLYQSPYWRPGNVPERQLDERELSLRNRAYQRAYGVAAAVPLLGMIWTALALEDGRLARYLWLPSTFDEASILFWGVFLLVISLPAAMLAWEGEAFE